MMVSHERLLADIAGIIRQRDQIDHPIHALLFDGKLSRGQLREFVGQTSCIPLYNQRYHGRLYVNCPDHQWRSRIAEVVYEEGTGRLFAGGVPHHELYLRHGEAVGIGRQELYDWPLCAEAIGYMNWFANICGRSFIEGASAHMLASEAVGMTVYTDVANALKTHHGLSDEDVKFWTVHAIADEDHTSIGRELLDEFARTEEDQRLVLKAVEESHRMYRALDEGTYQAVLRAR